MGHGASLPPQEERSQEPKPKICMDVMYKSSYHVWNWELQNTSQSERSRIPAIAFFFKLHSFLLEGDAHSSEKVLGQENQKEVTLGCPRSHTWRAAAARSNPAVLVLSWREMNLLEGSEIIFSILIFLVSAEAEPPCFYFFEKQIQNQTDCYCYYVERA